MAKAKYKMVQFDNKAMALVPETWLHDDYQKCKWPPYNSFQILNAVKDMKAPESTWISVDIKLIGDKTSPASKAKPNDLENAYGSDQFEEIDDFDTVMHSSTFAGQTSPASEAKPNDLENAYDSHQFEEVDDFNTAMHSSTFADDCSIETLRDSCGLPSNNLTQLSQHYKSSESENSSALSDALDDGFITTEIQDLSINKWNNYDFNIEASDSFQIPNVVEIENLTGTELDSSTFDIPKVMEIQDITRNTFDLSTLRIPKIVNIENLTGKEIDLRTLKNVSNAESMVIESLVDENENFSNVEVINSADSLLLNMDNMAHDPSNEFVNTVNKQDNHAPTDNSLDSEKISKKRKREESASRASEKKEKINSKQRRIDAERTFMGKFCEMKPVNTSPLGAALSNPKNFEVNTTRSGPKEYSCIFCPNGKKLRGKLIDHLLTKHRDQPRVMEIMALPPGGRKKGEKLNEGQLKRQKMIAEIKKEGSFKGNCKLEEGQFQVNRRAKNQKSVDDFRACPFCYGFYAKYSIRKHIPKCSKQLDYANRTTRPLHNLLIGDIHPDANKYLRIVASRLRADNDVSKIAKKDLLITLYGNYEAFKYRSSTHHHKQIRAEIRLLARILMSMKKKHPTITDLISCLDPKYSKAYIQTADDLGIFDSTKGIFLSAATARDVGRIMASVCDIWIAECIERELPAAIRKKAEDFLLLHRVKFPKLISKTVSESQTYMDIKKGMVKLPTTSDIKLLVNFVTNGRDAAYNKLSNKFDYSTWLQLLQTTLISIMVFNRKRPGELSQLLIAFYENYRQAISETTNPEYYKQLTPKAKEIASKYVRLLLRGKKNKKITPVLLDQKMLACLKLILKLRQNAGVPDENPYVFGLPSRNNEVRYQDAGPLLAKYSADCGAKTPTLLRGTRLRKQVATTGIALNLTNGQIGDLSKFMGHEPGIHNNVYRQPVGTQDIMQVSQVLEYAQGDYIETPNGNIVINEEEVSLSDFEECDDEKNLPSTAQCLIQTETRKNIVKKPKEVQQPSTNSRISWTDECIKIVLDNFGERYFKNESITGVEIQAVIDANRCFQDCNKKIANVRSFLQHYQKKAANCNDTKSQNDNRRRSQDEKTPKNRVPQTFYKCFSTFIESGEVPTKTECAKYYNMSPTLCKYSPEDIQQMVAKAIDFDKSNLDDENSCNT